MYTLMTKAMRVMSTLVPKRSSSLSKGNSCMATMPATTGMPNSSQSAPLFMAYDSMAALYSLSSRNRRSR